MSGIRAQNFGDLIFVDHGTVTFRKKEVLFLLVLDAATSKTWVAAQHNKDDVETQAKLREWMHDHNCVPKAAFANMAFSVGTWDTFWTFHGIKI